MTTPARSRPSGSGTRSQDRLATHARDDEFVYLDNGVVRVGIDLTRGGSIGFLADAHTPTTNLINTHDMGREVQLSFYAPPNTYNPPTAAYPDGACDHLFMIFDVTGEPHRSR